MSEKPALHAVQMPPVTPAVQVAQSLAQNAHVPERDRKLDGHCVSGGGGRKYIQIEYQMQSIP